MNNLIKNNAEFILSIGIIGLLLLAYDPFGITMPSSLQMATLVTLLLVLSLFLVVFWKEKSHDEREELHKHYSGKVAYTAGILSLMIVISTQLLHHKYDIWAPITMAIMIITKILARKYLDTKY